MILESPWGDTYDTTSPDYLKGLTEGISTQGLSVGVDVSTSGGVTWDNLYGGPYYWERVTFTNKQMVGPTISNETASVGWCDCTHIVDLLERLLGAYGMRDITPIITNPSTNSLRIEVGSFTRFGQRLALSYQISTGTNVRYVGLVESQRSNPQYWEIRPSSKTSTYLSSITWTSAARNWTFDLRVFQNTAEDKWYFYVNYNVPSLYATDGWCFLVSSTAEWGASGHVYFINASLMYFQSVSSNGFFVAPLYDQWGNISSRSIFYTSMGRMAVLRNAAAHSVENIYKYQPGYTPAQIVRQGVSAVLMELVGVSVTPIVFSGTQGIYVIRDIKQPNVWALCFYKSEIFPIISEGGGTSEHST